MRLRSSKASITQLDFVTPDVTPLHRMKTYRLLEKLISSLHCGNGSVPFLEIAGVGQGRDRLWKDCVWVSYDLLKSLRSQS